MLFNSRLKSRIELVDLLKNYQSNFQEEAACIDRFLHLLQSNRCYYRDHLPGHLTASAWIVNPENTHTLLVHHAKLNRWLQPGGHADGDEDLLNVAQKEMHEDIRSAQYASGAVSASQRIKDLMLELKALQLQRSLNTIGRKTP